MSEGTYQTHKDCGFMGERSIIADYDYLEACKGSYQDGMKMEPDFPSEVENVAVYLTNLEGQRGENITAGVIAAGEMTDLQNEILESVESEE